jgi:hypothetical protein
MVQIIVKIKKFNFTLTPFIRNLNGGYVFLPEGAGLYPWSTGTKS